MQRIKVSFDVMMKKLVTTITLLCFKLTVFLYASSNSQTYDNPHDRAGAGASHCRGIR